MLTKQNRLNNNESGWETIVSNYSSMAIPIAHPISGDTTGHVTFDADANDDVALIFMPDINEIGVVIDRSGSMSGTALQLAKKAGTLLVELTHEPGQVTTPKNNIVNFSGDDLSIVSFSSSASVDYAPGGK